VLTTSPVSVLIGGTTNVLSSSGVNNTVINGISNSITGTGNYNAIIGGEGSTITSGEDNGIFAAKNSTTGVSSSYSVIIGGRTHNATNQFATILGGAQHTVGYLSAAIAGFNLAADNGSVALGGQNNTANSGDGGVHGGTSNVVNSSSSVSSILYSTNSTISSSGGRNHIIGGCCNTIGSAYCQVVIIGGNTITADRSNTAYVSSLIATGQGASLIYDLGNWPTATQTVNWDEGNNQKVSIDTSVTTLTLSNPIAGANYMLQITQGGAGSNTVTWPASVKWAYNNPPVLTTAVGRIDVINLFYDGTSYLGTFALNFI
jgi:hypothetical protein